jgi:predicted O-methyltransferase YrrM
MSHLVEHPEDYFRRFLPPRDALLSELEQEADKEDIPIVGPLVGQLLFILATISGSKRILEVGTATGYSAIYLARALNPVQGHLVTIEKQPEMAARAARNLRSAGLDRLVNIVIGNALDQLESMQPGFDLIFLDIDKKSYADCLPHCRRLLRPGGLLVADNVSFVDADPFNQVISTSSQWKAIHLYSFLPAHSPEMDALCLALRL